MSPRGFHRLLLPFALGAALVSVAVSPRPQADSPKADSVTRTGARFATVDIFVDSREAALGAWQVEFSDRSGAARLAGVEGGEHAAYKQPPYYDPEALQRERVILAGFNTAAAGQLPRGRTRVATLHLHITGSTPVDFAVKVTAAADSEGRRIAVDATVQERKSEP